MYLEKVHVKQLKFSIKIMEKNIYIATNSWNIRKLCGKEINDQPN